MLIVIDLLEYVLWIASMVILVQVVASWLVAFNVVNARNDVVRAVWEFLHRVTEPALRPIRRILPNLGGVDVSPIILLLGIFFLQRIIALYLYPAVF